MTSFLFPRNLFIVSLKYFPRPSCLFIPAGHGVIYNFIPRTRAIRAPQACERARNRFYGLSVPRGRNVPLFLMPGLGDIIVLFHVINATLGLKIVSEQESYYARGIIRVLSSNLDYYSRDETHLRNNTCPVLT